jgi:hypothetical protein
VNSRKQIRFAAVAIGLAVVAAAGASGAQADPTNPVPPPYRVLNGVGSDTTTPVMNALSNIIKGTDGVTKAIGSYDATGSAQITTGTASTCTINRPNGSGAGRAALLNSLTLGDDCLQFSRSSSLTLTYTAPNEQLTYVPFAEDGVTFALAGDTSLPHDITLATLQQIYTCQITGLNVELPQPGSGTRSFWEGKMGILDTDVTAGKYPCITDLAGGNLIEEQDGRALTTPTSIIPFSVAAYDAEQTGDLVGDPDFDAGAILGSIGEVTPQSVNGLFPITREVYNVIPTADQGTAPWSTVFVGAGSAMCTGASAATIEEYGFSVAPDCGSTTNVTAATP